METRNEDGDSIDSRERVKIRENPTAVNLVLLRNTFVMRKHKLTRETTPYLLKGIFKPGKVTLRYASQRTWDEKSKDGIHSNKQARYREEVQGGNRGGYGFVRESLYYMPRIVSYI